MPLKTLVKVSAVNNLNDARYCAGMGVTLMGLPLESNHPYYIAPEQFKAITQWIQGVALVGELNTVDSATIHHTLSHYQLDYLQLSHPVTPEVIAAIDIPTLLRLVLHGDETEEELNTLLDRYASCVAYFLIEAASTDQAFISRLQEQVEQLAKQLPILQGFNITADNLTYLVEQTSIKGIALQGGTEIRPGYKDFDQLQTLLAPLEID